MFINGVRRRLLQDMSLEEQDDYWDDIEEKENQKKDVK